MEGITNEAYDYRDEHVAGHVWRHRAGQPRRYIDGPRGHGAGPPLNHRLRPGQHARGPQTRKQASKQRRQATPNSSASARALARIAFDRWSKALSNALVPVSICAGSECGPAIGIERPDIDQQSGMTGEVAPSRRAPRAPPRGQSAPSAGRAGSHRVPSVRAGWRRRASTAPATARPSPPTPSTSNSRRSHAAREPPRSVRRPVRRQAPRHQSSRRVSTRRPSNRQLCVDRSSCPTMTPLRHESAHGAQASVVDSAQCRRDTARIATSHESPRPCPTTASSWP
jgi:hypothetical protein